MANLPKKPRGTTTQRGYGHAHQELRRKLFARYPVCQGCGENWSQHLHHINGNSHDRSPHNLTCLCERCHAEIHHGNG